MKRIGLLTGAIGLWTQIAMATELASLPPPPDLSKYDALFRAGQREATLNCGVMFSPFGAPQNRPVIDYTTTSLQIGWMLGDVVDRGIVSGNFEFLIEAFADDIYDGPGDYIAGGTLWLRYNFLQPGWRFVPYVHSGAGLTWTDVDPYFVGQTFQFNLNLGLGVRYLFAQNWSVNVEFRYQHISNADTAAHNVGINSTGPILGLSFFF